MVGNVSEWTADGYGAYPKGKATNPLGMEAPTRVIRGGNWVTAHDGCRVAVRSTRSADKPKSTIG
jgi:formylglycine-generating enzyme required for sulfatase activity